jgi:hypothetical protein
MRPLKNDGNPSLPYGEKMPARLKGDAMLGAADGSVNELMRMLGAVPGYRAADFYAPPPPEDPTIRFYNVTSDQPFSPNIIRGQIYDTKRDAYGGDMSLGDILNRSKKDPALAAQLSELFGPGVSKKAFQKRFGRDVDFARLFVDVEGKRGGIGKANVINRGGKADGTEGARRTLCDVVPEACR